MPSFDVVSEVNMQEVRNAVDQTHREITTRYDFKGVIAEVELQEKDSKIMLHTADKGKLEAIVEILKQKLSKRGVSVKSIEVEEAQKAGGDTLRQEVKIKQGLTSEELKRLNKMIKDAKLKVTAQIQGEQLRVTSKKRDDLQEVIALLKQGVEDLNLQFTNFRD